MIPEAQAFNDASAALKAHSQQARDLDLDVAIAKRGGDTAAIEAAETAKATHATAWHALYKGEKEAALILCNALGVDAQALRWALPS